MPQQNNYRLLDKNEIQTLKSQGCWSDDWAKIKVCDGFDISSVCKSGLMGKVRIGKTTGMVSDIYGVEKPAGIYNSVIIDCSIGDNVRIANTGVAISSYDIADNVCIENAGTIKTNSGASFGNGVEVSVLNEAGGREVILFDELNVQFAYLMCLHRYRPKLIEQLKKSATDYAKKVKSDRGKIGSGAKICSVGEIIDVNIGDCAVINGTASLINGSILSNPDAVTTIGSAVSAKDFIIAEGASVTGAAIIEKTFVGQASKIGKQFSAENCLFFANSEAFHGEGCSVFAGPYTVTHHKSTLLIAGLFSFYNAGSGTNQSNHMYKLGPAHEGKLERGTKTGSFSYMMWPCNVGPFSVVLGKHMRNFDTSQFPFTHIEAGADGKCTMLPGMHLITVGTVRDGAKWPKRDGRKGENKRDIINFDVFSPYTVGKMIKASAILKQLQDTTDRAVEVVTIKGAQMKRVLLRTSQKFYRTGIEMYLGSKLLGKVEKALGTGTKKLNDIFSVESDAVYSEEWVDIGGQLMPSKRLIEFVTAVQTGKIGDVESFSSGMLKILECYAKDEWAWVKNKCKDVFNLDLDKTTGDDVAAVVEAYGKTRVKFLKMVLVDSGKEFDESSQMGFGRDGTCEDVEKDFQQVRGVYEDNSFVEEMKAEIAAVEKKVSDIKQKVLSLS